MPKPFKSAFITFSSHKFQYPFSNLLLVKGVITIAISALLFVDIIVHSFIITYPLFGMWLAGKTPIIDEKTLMPLRTLLVVITIALVIWVWALVDTVIVGKKRLAESFIEGN